MIIIELSCRTSLGPDSTYLHDLLNNLSQEFIEELNHYEKASKRSDTEYNVWEYGEITMVTYLTHALRRIDKEYQRFIFMQEIGLENESRQAQGRADLIIQDLSTNSVIIVEAKKYHSRPIEPTTVNWKKEITEEHYRRVMNQCTAYYLTEKGRLTYYKDIYCLSMIFDSVKFRENNQHYIEEWINYQRQFEHEYYYFFSDLEHKYGLAIYGTYEKIVE